MFVHLRTSDFKNLRPIQYNIGKQVIYLVGFEVIQAWMLKHRPIII